MFGMLIFALSAALLVGGFFVYGKIAEKVYGVDTGMRMPAVEQADGVDYVAIPTWRVFLIQLLNIAGLGPVFGALSGCLFGPVALLWIVLGCLLGGTVHDFYAAVASAEKGGSNLPELVKGNLGKYSGYLMRGVCIVLMLMVGVVFTQGPAGMLHGLVSEISVVWWCVIILGYYFLATVLPIDVIVGKIYPIFGLLFLVMVVGVAVALPQSPYEVLPYTDFFSNMHPSGISVWPVLFVTIACGAISGFHATQSPMMVRCLAQAKNLRTVFYGAMVVEGLVALVWAVAGITLRDVLTSYTLADGQLVKAVTQGEAVNFMTVSLKNPAIAVSEASFMLLGKAGAVLALLGVVVLPITSGDTAMRCCRLMLADALGLEQKKVAARLALVLPIFAMVIIIANLDFAVIWRYFGWANQTLACFTLWSLAVLLRRRSRMHWIVTLPALFMTMVCCCFLLSAPDCLICMDGSYSLAISFGVALLFLWLLLRVNPEKNDKVGE